MRFDFHILVIAPPVILIVDIIFHSPFLDVVRMSMSTVSFLAQPDFGIICLQNV